MVTGEAQRLVELAPPLAGTLAGAGVDQIERKPGERLAGVPDRGDRLVPVVRPAEKAQG